MRIALSRFCLTTALAAACAGNPPPGQPRPVKVGDYWRVRCDSGPSATRPLAFVLRLPMGAGAAALTVRDALQAAGYSSDFEAAMWHTVPRTAWPESPAAAPWRTYPYPGTAVELMLAASAGVPIVFGSVYPLCAIPGAPDSVTAIARRLELDRLSRELRLRGAQ